jgi:hypothetical protein
MEQWPLLQAAELAAAVHAGVQECGGRGFRAFELRCYHYPYSTP